ncbi:MAG: HAD hydrolase-like protein [Alphaproteobacteria bacterium]|nr:HAD hydrolase-like protein [Alphaproteobacteria bacterium]
MRQKPKAILFDWDGTLAETRPAVVDSMEYVLKRYGKEPWDITKAKYRDTTKSLKENFVNFFQEDAPRAYQQYLEYYEINGYSKIKPMENADVFMKLCQNKGIDLYVVSNKERKLLLKEISYCFPAIKFKKVLANGDAPHNKPAPDPVFVALSDVSYPINRENVFLVGDSKQDTECAFNASVFPVLLGKGKFMDDDYIKMKKQSDEPLLVINTFADFIRLMGHKL